MLQRIVRVSCPDRTGLVSIITTAFADRGLNIHQLDQFTNDGSFFVRAVIEAADGRFETQQAEDEEFRRLGERLSASLDDAEVEIRPHPAQQRIVVLASKTDHCLNEMIRRAQAGQLGGQIVKVVANHDVHRELCEFHGIPFVVVPHEGLSKPEHEAAVLEAIGEDVDLIVLARYMRILSDEFLQKAPTPIINIHHSFLPGFKGANPYRQAHRRGVKQIGATAHFVTTDLDEGPIIEQNVTRVDHTRSPAELMAIGQDTECRTLRQAVSWFAQQRVLLDGARTVIFR